MSKNKKYTLFKDFYEVGLPINNFDNLVDTARLRYQSFEIELSTIEASMNSQHQLRYLSLDKVDSKTIDWVIYTALLIRREYILIDFLENPQGLIKQLFRDDTPKYLKHIKLLGEFITRKENKFDDILEIIKNYFISSWDFQASNRNKSFLKKLSGIICPSIFIDPDYPNDYTGWSRHHRRSTGLDPSKRLDIESMQNKLSYTFIKRMEQLDKKLEGIYKSNPWYLCCPSHPWLQKEILTTPEEDPEITFERRKSND